MFQQRLADRSARPAAIDHRLEVATQMGPTPLDPLEVPVRRPAVTGRHVGKGHAEQLHDDVPPAGAGDVKDGDQRGDDRPQPGPLLVLAPTGLVEVDVLRADVPAQLVVGRRQQVGRPPSGACRSCRSRSTGRTSRRAVAAPAACPTGRRRRATRPSPTAAARRRRPASPAAARRWSGSATPAGQRVQAVFGDVGLDRRDLRHLAA